MKRLLLICSIVAYTVGCGSSSKECINTGNPDSTRAIIHGTDDPEKIDSIKNSYPEKGGGGNQ